jgi:hypothetical protein
MSLFQKAWKDPVWSKVIAAPITVALGAIGTAIWGLFTGVEWSRPVTLPTWEVAYKHLYQKEITPHRVSKKLVALGGKKGVAGRGNEKVTAFAFDDERLLKLGALPNGDEKWKRLRATFAEIYLGEASEDEF